MITRRWPKVGWLLTAEDIDEDRMRESMEMLADPLFLLMEEIEEALRQEGC